MTKRDKITSSATYAFMLMIVVLFLATVQTARAATRTWDGGGATENWSEAANWSDDTVPEINDSVVFDGTTGKSCVINISFVAGVNSLSATTLENTYTGTVSIAPGLSTNFFGSLTIRGGTFALADGSFNLATPITLNGGAFNTGSGPANLTLLLQNGGTFNGSSGDIVLSGGITINSGTFNASTGNNSFGTNAAQNFIQTGGIFNGNGTVDINGIFQLTGGTFNASPGNTSFGAGFVHTIAGTFDNQNGTVIFDSPDDRTATVSTNGNREIFNNVVFFSPTNNAAFTFANPTIFQINGSLDILNGVINSSFPSSPTNGFELHGNVTVGVGADGGTAAMRFAGTANQTVTNNGGVNPTNTWRIDKPAGVVSLGNDLTLGSTQLLDIVAGEFSHGVAANLTVGAVNIGAGGVWRNNGLGDITLGGNVTNAGEIDIDAISISCNEADLILIRSSISGTQRSWSGTGSFFIQDADIRDQAGTAAITAFAGTDTGNNGANWSFDTACSKFTWDGGGATNNWTEAANWSRNIVPLNTLVVHFNATSSKDVVIDASLQVNGLRIESGYAGTISHLTAATLLVVGSGTGSQGFVQSGGTYAAGRLQVFGEASILGGTFAGTSALKEFLGDLTISNATYSNSGTSRIGGNLTVTSPILFSPGPRVEFDRATNAAVTVPSGTQFDQLVIDKSAESAFVDFAPGSGVIVTGMLALVGGQLNGDAVTVVGLIDITPGFDGGSGTVSIQSPSPGGIIGTGAALPQSFIVNSPAAFVSMSGVFATHFVLQSGTVSANGGEFAGNYSQSGGTYEYGPAQAFFNGSFTLTGGNFQSSVFGGTTIEMNGDVVLNGGSFSSPFMLFVKDDFRINGAAFNHNNGTVVFSKPATALIQVGTDQLIFNHVRFSSAFLTMLQTLDGTSWITAEGTATFENGGFERLPASPAIPSFRAKGNVSMTNFGFNTLLGLRFEGSTNQTFAQTGGLNFNGWTVDKTGGTLNLLQDTTVDILFLQNGTITTGTHTLTPVNSSRSNGWVIGNLRQNFDFPANRTFHVGTENGYSPVAANATAAVIGSSLTISATESARAGMNSSQSAGRFWTLTETGDLTVDLVFNYLQADVAGDESTYKLYKWTGTSATFVPSNLDTAANTVSATGISDFSDWAIGNLAPSAASATLSGRVLDSNGRPIPNAVVTLTHIGQTVATSARTNPFGYYSFTGVRVGEYIVAVQAKGRDFDPPSRFLTLHEDLTLLDFIALPY